MALVGGGARDAGLVQAFKEVRGHDILVPTNPYLTAALGAAIIAMESLIPSFSPPGRGKG
jgi:activator of 2-hydroxyglutaryl-CoA dehydratase